MNHNDFGFTDKSRGNEQELFYTSYTPEQENSAYTSKQEYESVSKRAIEIPLPNKPKLSTVIMIIALVICFVSMLGFVAAGIKNNVYLGLMVQFGIMAVFSALAIATPFIDRYRLKKVCTVRTQGTYAGYDSRVRSSKYGNYNVYAPKYEIFINGHYEIRTLDDFSRSLDFSAKMDLLVNPDGHEIMPADGSISRSAKRRIVLILIMIVWTVIIVMPFLVKRVF